MKECVKKKSVLIFAVVYVFRSILLGFVPDRPDEDLPYQNPLMAKEDTERHKMVNKVILSLIYFNDLAIHFQRALTFDILDLGSLGLALKLLRNPYVGNFKQFSRTSKQKMVSQLLIIR